MLSFMHWTHRTYPYGPLWLFLSIPFSWLGHSYFLLTFFLFKAGIAASFVGSLYYIEKIMEKISPKRSVETLVIVAFHPLFIIENLISAHNDIVMMFFTLLSLYLLINKKQVLSGVSFICSIAIKFATVFLLPSIVFLGIAQRKKIPNVWNLFFLFSGCCLLVAVLYASHQSNFQPWYLVWPLSFFFLLPLSHYGKTSLIVSVFSIVSLLLYVPYLYNGDWNKAIPTSYFIILWSVILVYALGAGIISMIRNK